MHISFKPLAIAATLAILGMTSVPVPATAQTIEVQYRDRDRYDPGLSERRDVRRDRNERDRYDRDRYERRGPPPRILEERRDRRYDRGPRLSRRDRACLATYRSYDPRTGLFRDRNGRLRECRL